MRRDSTVTAQGTRGKRICPRRLSLGVLLLGLLCWSFSVTHLSRRAAGAVSPSSPSPGALVDVAPFGSLLPAGNGIAWDDPREIQRVVVRFRGRAPAPERVILQYMGSAWPEQHWPENEKPGGGSTGWAELGDWYRGGWRAADAVATAWGNAIAFTFRPVNEYEFPQVGEYPATFRTTLKLRVLSAQPMPLIARIEAYTDSVWERRSVELVFKQAPRAEPSLEAFNGRVEYLEPLSPRRYRAHLWSAANPDPNTYDRTLVTVREPAGFTFSVADMKRGPLFLPQYGVAVLPEGDGRSYAAVARDQKERAGAALYDRVAALPEQSWRAAWSGMPPKSRAIYLPLGLDGGRQHFRLDADGSVSYRLNDRFIRNRPGRDTTRLAGDGAPLRFSFALPDAPAARTIEDGVLPIGRTTWDVKGVRVEQQALVTTLAGTRAEGPPPPGDAFAIFLARFTLTNPSRASQTARFSLQGSAGRRTERLTIDAAGRLWSGRRLRGQVVAGGKAAAVRNSLQWSWTLAPGESRELLVKLPYVPLTDAAERAALARLEFAREHAAVAAYWRRQVSRSARLITPEPMLNDFYRAHVSHLLINAERAPAHPPTAWVPEGNPGYPAPADLRHARVGSFLYGSYGNESSMMVLDLDRRGYHAEARQCLEAWLRYQGTVGLPGDFSSKEGVFHGAGGYEEGGYNQDHGWILWCLAEHYRYTRDAAWLRRAAPGILAGAEWIIRERSRTAGKRDLGRGLLPAGALEDVGDWWPWLSTNCYTWRGLDAAAWALSQLGHPAAARLQQEADAYHRSLLTAFREAARRAPVERLRDGTAVLHFPSHAQRRGRSFGWITETLEGALHLLISGALDSRSPEAAAILKDYEDNLYLSHQWGYSLDDFDEHWFGRGGISMQSCLLLSVEPYLGRDDVKHALRALFNGIAAGYFPDVRMITEHALPDLGDYEGDHFKSSDEANAAGWLRQLFIREDGEELLLGQAVPRDWLKPGQLVGIERAATHFGPMSLRYEGARDQITARLTGPRRNPPRAIRLRFRDPAQRRLASVTVNGRRWTDTEGEWVRLPGSIGSATVVARWHRP